MEPETERKIEETMKDILKEANMDEMTEFKLRLAASTRLGLDLSGADHKKFVRTVLESFLLSTTADDDDRDEAGNGGATETVKLKKEIGGADDVRFICKLSDKRNVEIQGSRGKACLYIRDYHPKNGKLLPSTGGMNLTSEQWSAMKKNILAIEEAIKKLQPKSRSQPTAEQNGDVSNAVTDGAHGFVPVETSRFDGKNFLCWASQMELFLRQLKLAHVLVQTCPSSSLGPEVNPKELSQAKAAKQKWASDDYLCRHHILNSLSDTLYHQYSNKTKSAKELWDELKWVYLYEESGTSRSQVRKYIEFKMVEEKPLVEQIQEFNKIADAIVASGMFLDENFHVSVIISKFPPSWKGFCIKLLQEDYVPVWMLMDQVKAEEESRDPGTRKDISKFTRFHVDHNGGSRMRDTRRPNISWKRKEPERESRPICSNCSKRGHIAKNCWDKKSDRGANEKPNGDSSAVPVVAEVNTANKKIE